MGEYNPPRPFALLHFASSIRLSGTFPRKGKAS
jgi:hypothetical protein